jgi:hypothetical protein
LKTYRPETFRTIFPATLDSDAHKDLTTFENEEKESYGLRHNTNNGESTRIPPQLLNGGEQVEETKRKALTRHPNLPVVGYTQ